MGPKDPIEYRFSLGNCGDLLTARTIYTPVDHFILFFFWDSLKYFLTPMVI